MNLCRLARDQNVSTAWLGSTEFCKVHMNIAQHNMVFMRGCAAGPTLLRKSRLPHQARIRLSESAAGPGGRACQGLGAHGSMTQGLSTLRVWPWPRVPPGSVYPPGLTPRCGEGTPPVGKDGRARLATARGRDVDKRAAGAARPQELRER